MTMRKRWWILGAMGVATAALAVSGTVWWHSTADLDEVAARARAMGIPPTYEDIPNPEIADPAEVAALTAIEGLAEPLLVEDCFSEADGLEGDLYWRMHGRDADPDPLQVMAMAHGTMSLARLRAAVDALPDRPIRVGEPRDALFPHPWLGSARMAVRALQPQVRWGDDPVMDLARMTRVCEATPQPMPMDRLSVVAVRFLVLVSAGRVHARIPSSDPMVAVWERWAREPILEPREMYREVRIWIQTYRKASPWDLAPLSGLGSAQGWPLRALAATAVRRGRAGALHAHLDLLESLAATTGSMPRRALVRLQEARIARVSAGWRRALLDPVAWNLQHLTPAGDMVSALEWKQRIMAGLVVALVRGEPIPIDPTDPAGGPLRRYERNGELIGYYACGDDGIDNGGSTDDWRIPFDRPWDPPPAP
jgi:hypothetical protein